MTSAQIYTTATLEALEADNNRLKGEIKMKEELIPGMEKMIAYLNKIQEENKKLKEENKKLEKEVKLLHDQLEDDGDDKICDLLECDHDGRYDAISELIHKADNWELKYHTLRNELNLSSESEEE